VFESHHCWYQERENAEKQLIFDSGSRTVVVQSMHDPKLGFQSYHYQYQERKKIPKKQLILARSSRTMVVKSTYVEGLNPTIVGIRREKIAKKQLIYASGSSGVVVQSTYDPK
jgi:hypothetical protein